MARFSRRRFVLLVLTVGSLGQLPGALLIHQLLRPLRGGVEFAVTLGLLLCLNVPLWIRLSLGNPERTERGLLGALLLATYSWWAASMLAGATWLPARLACALAGAPPAFAAVVALAIGGALAISGVTFRRLVARLSRVTVLVDGLPPELDGYTIAHLSDLHMGGHTPPRRVRRWVDRVNALAPDLVAVTGDLITSGDGFLDDVARELGRLRGRDGVALCMGNHDYFGDHRRLVSGLEAQGIDVLRNRGRLVQRGAASFWLAGVDDTWRRLDDVEAALAGRPGGAPSIVLAHDPSLFPACAERGATLVLSGHTHGGQIALPIWSRFFNVARISFRYTAGKYRLGRSQLYVSRGAGTTGPPIRIGAPSEIALLTLRPA